MCFPRLTTTKALLPFFSYFIFFGLISSIVSCEGCFPNSICSEFETSCKSLQAGPLTDRFIIQLNETYILTIKRNHEVSELDFPSYFQNVTKDSLEARNIEAEIINFCGCGLLLMKADINIGIEEQVAGAKSKLKQNGDIGTADFDFIINIGPNPDPTMGGEYPNPNPNKDTSSVNYTPRSPQSDPNIVKVAIIDTGSQFNHDDLANVMWENSPEIIGGNDDDDDNCFPNDIIGFDFVGQQASIIDMDGHGTHVAGIVANKLSEEEGIDLRILNLKVIEQDNSTLFNAVCGIHYANEKNADIINLSWGYYANEASEILKNALEASKAKKIIVVTSAGNDNMNVDCCLHWPSNFMVSLDNVLSIAALDKINITPASTPQFKLADYSNYGSYSVLCAAEGTDINSAYSNPYTTNTEEILSGTSMAAPAVTAELAKLRVQNPSMSYPNLINKLVTSRANSLDVDNTKATFSKKYIIPN